MPAFRLADLPTRRLDGQVGKSIESPSRLPRAWRGPHPATRKRATLFFVTIREFEQLRTLAEERLPDAFAPEGDAAHKLISAMVLAFRAPAA